jgi:hypothetical protein
LYERKEEKWREGRKKGYVNSSQQRRTKELLGQKGS